MTWRLKTLIIFFLASTCFLSQASAQVNEAEQLKNLLDDSWEFDLREDPLYATRVGDHRYDDLLPRQTIADNQRRLEAKRQFLQRLKQINRDKLTRPEQINYDTFRRLTEDEIAEYELETYLIPITNRWGFHTDFPELPQRMPIVSLEDYENYIGRLNAFEQYADDHIELMRAGFDKGLVLPAVVLDGYEDSIEPHIVEDPTKSLLYRPFVDFPDTISQNDRERLSAAARAAITESVVPGYIKFRDFMKQEYVPATRGSIGASAMPNGRELYRHRVRKYTTLDITPEEVHQIGLDEVKRIRAEMDQVIRETGFDGNFQQFVEFLRTDPQFYVETPEQLMKETAYVLKRMDGQLPRLFKTLPRSQYGIREIPAYIAPKTTSAYYMWPSGDGKRAGFYYVNTYNLKSRPLYDVEALSLHEAVPGHHLQLALQQEMTDLHLFRRFNEFTVYVEGWALYAERLGLEVGFYEDPYSNFGRLSFEMWRACRLVVDTGIHYLGWTRKQAIDYMAENTSLSLHNIEAEVDRYISWPGQALAYKIGELKIRELRAKAEKELGDEFDVREFHDTVLASGSVPLDVLEGNVNRYIEATVTQSHD